MQHAPIPLDDDERLHAISRLGILEAPREAFFEHIAELARMVAQTSMSAFSIVGQDKQHFLATAGTDITDTSREISICAHTVCADHELIVHDTAADPRFEGNPLVVGRPHIHYYVGLPIHSPDGYCVGTLAVFDPKPRQPKPGELKGLGLLAALLEHDLAARAASGSDPLTGLYTMPALTRRLEEEWRRQARSQGRVSVLAVDIDQLKVYNQTYGEAAGDQVIRQVGGVLKDGMRRPGDAIGRDGGGMFFVVLSGNDPTGAAQVAERLRAAVDDACIPNLALPAPAQSVTVSIGLATVGAIPHGVSEELFADAREALQAAKTAGRNCVQAYRA